MANTLNLDIYRGDTKTLRMRFNSGAIQGDLIRMMARQDMDGEALITKEAVVNGDEAVITIESSDTQSLDPGTYIYDVELVRGDKVVTLIEMSRLRLRGDVTHD